MCVGREFNLFQTRALLCLPPLSAWADRENPDRYNVPFEQCIDRLGCAERDHADRFRRDTSLVNQRLQGLYSSGRDTVFGAMRGWDGDVSEEFASRLMERNRLCERTADIDADADHAIPLLRSVAPSARFAGADRCQDQPAQPHAIR